MKTIKGRQHKNTTINKEKQRIPGVVLLVLLWMGLSLFCWFKPSEAISYSERRKLAQFPAYSGKAVYSGAFMEQFDEAAADQFPFRERFRELGSVTDLYVLQKRDVKGIYLAEGYLAEMEYPLSESSVRRVGGRFQSLYDTYMKDTDVSLYLAVIPDKNYYLGNTHGYLTMDYGELNQILRQEFDVAEVISLEDTLSIPSYYKTDSHWRQEQLAGTAERILEAMGGTGFEDLRQETAVMDFHGVYSGQSALPVSGEPIYYLTNDTLEQCRVYNVEHDRETGIYDTEKLTGRDPYDFFLSGSAAVLIIDNPDGDPDRELVVFRDSFGSSLVPLLVRSYGTITVIDTRYMNPELIGDYVEFQDQDVLFLYSTLLLNQGETIR